LSLGPICRGMNVSRGVKIDDLEGWYDAEGGNGWG
jgi:hypothetical protein